MKPINLFAATAAVRAAADDLILATAKKITAYEDSLAARRAYDAASDAAATVAGERVPSVEAR